MCLVLHSDAGRDTEMQLTSAWAHGNNNSTSFYMCCGVGLWGLRTYVKTRLEQAFGDVLLELMLTVGAVAGICFFVCRVGMLSEW